MSKPQTNKAVMKAELISKRLWSRFLKVRKQLLDSGMLPSEARETAYKAVTGVGVDGVGGEVLKVVGISVGNGLLSGSEFKNKPKCSLRSDIEWVYEHMGIEVKPEDAPSPGAYAYLIECQSDTSVRSEFYRSVITRMLPSKSQLDLEQERGTGGNLVLSQVERILAAGAVKSAGKVGE